MTTPARRAGIDVGGSKVLGVVVDPAGTVVAEHRVATPRTGAADVLDRIVELAQFLQPWDSLGVGVPGMVTRSGVLRAAPNLVGMDGVAVADELGETLGVPVAVDNDATCAAVAEWRAGAARGDSDVLLVTLGTGIGGGLVSNGRVQRGAHGFAGEIGHMVVDPDGPPCPCGRRGCWERYASGSALAAMSAAALADGRLSAVAAAGIGPSDVRGEHVQRAAASGDAEALAVIDAFARWVALGLVNLTNIVDPGTIVLGGGLARARQLYLAPIERWFSELLYASDQRPHPRLVFAELGERAGAVGAALMPAEHAQERWLA